MKFAKNKEKCAIWLYEDYQQSTIGNFHKYVMIGAFRCTRQTIIWSFGWSTNSYIVIWNENIHRDWSRDDQYGSFFLLFFFFFFFYFSFSFSFFFWSFNTVKQILHLIIISYIDEFYLPIDFVIVFSSMSLIFEFFYVIFSN